VELYGHAGLEADIEVIRLLARTLLADPRPGARGAGDARDAARLAGLASRRATPSSFQALN